MRKQLSILLVMCMIMVTFSGCTQTAKPVGPPADGAKVIPDVIKIGMVSSISGSQALDGVNMTDALKIVQDELKASGGLDVDGKKVQIEFIIEDNEAKPEITVNAVQKLIEQDGVLAIIGPNNSSDTIAGGEIAQSAKIPLITNTGTNIKVTEVGDYIFRACFIDPFQGKVVAKFAQEDLKAVNAAVLYDNADTYSSELAKAFMNEFEAIGGKIVASEAYSGAEIRDYSAQLTNIKNTNPDVIFFPSHIDTIPLQLQQARGMGIEGVLLGCDSWDYAALPNLVGHDVLEGAYYLTGFSPDAATAQEFVKTFTEKSGYKPSFCSGMLYEAAHIVLDSIQRAKTIDGPGIRDAMTETSMDLPSGHVEFDDMRNPIKSGIILQVKSGVAQYVKSIDVN